jgi:nucleotide-binding universal stress UspA family protein
MAPLAGARRCSGRSRRRACEGFHCEPFTPDVCPAAHTLSETPEIEIERVTAEGPAARVLIDAVGEDDLLVVGSRGHGGFSSLLLGSVSQQCAHHAPCPVVIVRGSAVAV